MMELIWSNVTTRRASTGSTTAMDAGCAAIRSIPAHVHSAGSGTMETVGRAALREIFLTTASAKVGSLT